MKRFAATLAYDGSAYCGFQRQAETIPTIQRSLECAIEKVAQDRVTINSAGRTDSGVHALGQVIAFDLEWKHSESELLQALNAQLPLDIALQDLWQQSGFHPRYHALWRQYVYRVATPPVRNPLLNTQVWQLVGQRLDLGRLQKAAERCLGEQDFAAFGRPPQEGNTNTVRAVFLAQWEAGPGQTGEVFTFRVRATAFLYHMVRRMVGTMVQVGSGRMTLAEFDRVLKSRDLQQAKILAPPQGLVLEAVRYPPHDYETLCSKELSLATTGA